MGTVIEGRELRGYVYVCCFFGGLVFTVEFVGVHDIHVYARQQCGEAFEAHSFDLFWPKAALLLINGFHDKVGLNLDHHCWCLILFLSASACLPWSLNGSQLRSHHFGEKVLASICLVSCHLRCST